MNKQAANNRQLPLWETEPTIPSPVILTNEQQAELTAALAELLLLSVTTCTEIRKGVHDAE
jgi:hypothetical protein